MLKMRTKYLLFIFILALILRLALVFIAHHGDLNNNITWGTIAAEGGLNGFYEGRGLPQEANNEVAWPYSAPNQPPLTIITFTFTRVIWQAVENTVWWLNNHLPIFPSPFIWFWEGKGMVLLIKLPAIIADLGIGFLIYRFFQRKNKLKLGLMLSSLWLFNPVTWYNSAIWGQTDSVVNLLGLAAILFLLNRKLIIFSLFFALSILFKGSLFIFAPLLFLVIIRQKYPLKELLRATFYMLLTTIFISIWFHPQFDLPLWLFNLYKNRILPGEIGYLTANAFNFWWLVEPGKVLDSTLYLGLQARVWGFIIAIAGIIGVSYWLLKTKLSDKRLFLSLSFLSLITFLFMTRIHERYLYPLFPYATMLLGLVPGLVLPYIILSITHLLNLYHLFWAPSFGPLEKAFTAPIFAQIISIIKIFIVVYLFRHFRAQKI